MGWGIHHHALCQILTHSSVKSSIFFFQIFNLEGGGGTVVIDFLYNSLLDLEPKGDIWCFGRRLLFFLPYEGKILGIVRQK